MTRNNITVDNTGENLYYNSGNGEQSVKLTQSLYLTDFGEVPPSANHVGHSYVGAIGGNKLRHTYFDHDTDRYGEVSVMMPSNWDGGSITAEFVWTTNDTTSNTVVWEIVAGGYGNGDNLSVAPAWPGVSLLSSNGGVAYQLRRSGQTVPITVQYSPLGGNLVVFGIARKSDDTNDTLAAGADLLGVVIRYGTTKMSS